MIDRRLPYVQTLERFLIQQNPDWAQGILLEQPPSDQKTNEFDLAIPCFQLSKSRRMPPPACALAIADQIRSAQSALGIEKIEAVKGFVNLRFSAPVLAEAVRTRMNDPLMGSRQAWAKETIAIDYSSPNIAKPFGIGHLRSTNIGGALCRILTAIGARVIRINHLGDWGTQFGKMITAYKRFGNAEFVRGDPINNLYQLYVEFHQKEQEHPELMDEAREWFVKLENGDPEALELWKWFKDVSYHEFKRMYDRLGVDFDYVTGESFYNTLMPKTVERLEKAGLLKESDGATIVDLEPYGMPPCLIKKSDGSTLYATRDISTAEYRAKTFHPTKLVYVVGSEQALHFRQVYKVLELMGHEWAKNCFHIAFGLIKFPEGKMSTRKGNIVLLEQVLDQAEAEALKIVQEKNREKPAERQLTPDEELEVARKVGSGAVIFFDLHAKRMKDILFDWKSILNFEGDSGPYLQYSSVRLESLMERAKAEGIQIDGNEAIQLTTDEERELVRSLLGFPAVVESAARDFEPSLIAHELLDIAAVFNRFYMNVPVLKGEAGLKKSRLALVLFTQRVLQTGLALLGLECPKKM